LLVNLLESYDDARTYEHQKYIQNLCFTHSVYPYKDLNPSQRRNVIKSSWVTGHVNLLALEFYI